PLSKIGFVGKGMNFFFGKRVKISPSLTTDFGTTKSFTIDAWIKGHAGPIVTNYDINLKTGFSVVNDGTKLRLDIGNGPSNPMTTVYGPPINPGVWTYIAVAVDRSNASNNIATLYTGTGTTLATPLAPMIPNTADASKGLDIGSCSGNPN